MIIKLFFIRTRNSISSYAKRFATMCKNFRRFSAFFSMQTLWKQAKRRKKMASMIFLNLLLFVEILGTMELYADDNLILGDIQTDKDNYIAGEQAKISFIITNTADITKQGIVHVKVTQGSIILLDESNPVSVAGGDNVERTYTFTAFDAGKCDITVTLGSQTKTEEVEYYNFETNILINADTFYPFAGDKLQYTVNVTNLCGKTIEFRMVSDLITSQNFYVDRIVQTFTLSAGSSISLPSGLPSGTPLPPGASGAYYEYAFKTSDPKGTWKLKVSVFPTSALDAVITKEKQFGVSSPSIDVKSDVMDIDSQGKQVPKFYDLGKDMEFNLGFKNLIEKEMYVDYTIFIYNEKNVKLYENQYYSLKLQPKGYSDSEKIIPVKIPIPSTWEVGDYRLVIMASVEASDFSIVKNYDFTLRYSEPNLTKRVETPSEVLVGVDNNIRIIIVNNDVADSEPFDLHIVIKDPDGEVIKSFKKSSVVLQGKFESGCTLPIEFTLRPQQVGTYNIYVVINSNYENPTVLSFTAKVTTIKHSVSIKKFSVSPQSVERGGTASVDFELENQGSVPESVRYSIFVEGSGVVDSNIKSILPGESVKGSTTIQTKDLGFGQREIKITIEYSEKIGEQTRYLTILPPDALQGTFDFSINSPGRVIIGNESEFAVNIKNKLDIRDFPEDVKEEDLIRNYNISVVYPAGITGESETSIQVPYKGSQTIHLKFIAHQAGDNFRIYVNVNGEEKSFVIQAVTKRQEEKISEKERKNLFLGGIVIFLIVVGIIGFLKFRKKGSAPTKVV